jgi:hypothetical protein
MIPGITIHTGIVPDGASVLATDIHTGIMVFITDTLIIILLTGIIHIITAIMTGIIRISVMHTGTIMDITTVITKTTDRFITVPGGLLNRNGCQLLRGMPVIHVHHRKPSAEGQPET